MLTLIIRSIFIYFLVLLMFRLMGKRQLGQMQPFELVLTLILADIATIPMTEISVPILHGIVPLLTLMLIHYIITLASRLNRKFSELVSGKPVIVINQDGVDYKAIKKLNLSIDDISESLRTAGYFSINQVLFAIMETNGKMSILPKAEFSPVVQQDLEIQSQENSYPVTVISEGKILKESFSQLKVNKDQIFDFLKKENINIKKILIFTIDNNGVVYLQEMYKKGQTIQTELKE